MQGVGFPLLVGKPFAPSAFSGCHHRRLESRLGAVLRPHWVLGVWSKKEILDHINSLDLKSALLTLQNLESHVLGRSVLICSDFHILSGRNSFLIPVSTGLGPVGMVSSEEYFSSRQFTFREKNTFWRIFSPRESISLQNGS